VAQLLWQRVYGVGAAGAAWRDDAVRGGCVEAAARNVAAGRAAAASAGVLYALVAASPEARGALLAARPPALPALAAAAGARQAPQGWALPYPNLQRVQTRTTVWMRWWLSAARRMPDLRHACLGCRVSSEARL